MKLAVVGGGWAGMAATHVLTQAGHNVTVFEISHQLGGRARGVDDPNLGDIDNGQHLLIGAYQQTLALIQSTQASQQPANEKQHPAFWRLPLNLISADRAIQIRTPGTLASRRVRLIGLLRAQGLTTLDRWLIVRLLGRLSIGLSRPTARQTVLTWLQQQQQSPRALNLLWVPLCLATMNTAPEAASAQLFARILQDSLLNKQAGATDLIIPRCNLTQLWCQAVAHNATVRLGAHIDQVTPQTPDATGIQQSDAFKSHTVVIHGEVFDGCIMATPPWVTRKIAQAWPGAAANELCQKLEAFDFLPITTCYVELDQALTLPYPMMMLNTGHGPVTNGLGQWVFDRNFILQPHDAYNEPADSSKRGKLAFVISHAGQQSVDRHTLAQTLVQQLWDELSDASRSAITTTTTDNRPATPQVVHSRIITEKRATFAATPGLSRPSVHSPWPQIKLAGDWTDTDYPAVLEGAVISGQQAAQALLKDLESPARTS